MVREVSSVVELAHWVEIPSSSSVLPIASLGISMWSIWLSNIQKFPTVWKIALNQDDQPQTWYPILQNIPRTEEKVKKNRACTNRNKAVKSTSLP